MNVLLHFQRPYFRLSFFFTFEVDGAVHATISQLLLFVRLMTKMESLTGCNIKGLITTQWENVGQNIFLVLSVYMCV